MRERRRFPRWASPVITFLVIYFAIDLLCFSILWWKGVPVVRWGYFLSHVPQAREMIWKVHAWVAGIAAVLSGLNSTANHPARQPKYRDWLRTTPWYPGTRLPLGPVTLAWRHAPVLAGLCGLAAWNSSATPIDILTAFACGCLFVAVGALMKTRTYAEAYLIVLGGAGLLWIARWPLALFIGSAALLAVAQFGLLRSLRSFPWDCPPNPAQLGDWPVPIYADFAPRVSRRRGIAIPLLLGAWTTAIVGVAGKGWPAGPVALCIVGGCAMASLVRVTAYASGFDCPIGFWKRLFTGRLIIPGYDQIWVAPLSAVALSLVIPLGLFRIAPTLLWAGITVLAVFLVLLNGGPVLRVWQLTGFHRAVGKGTGRRRRAVVT